MMESKKISRWTIAMVLLVGLVIGAVFMGVMVFNASPVGAQSGEVESDDADDGAEGPDVPITGTALDQASTAALEYIGEGRVTETEVGDEEGYYEVEITRDNGGQVDVHLDEAFNVLGHEDD